MRTLDYYQKVIILNCGGTIDMNKSKDVGASSVSKTVEGIKELINYYNIEIEFENVFDKSPDSSNIGSHEWDALHAAIVRIIKDKKAVKDKLIRNNFYPELPFVGGIVISHGTDTLHLTSLILALRLSLDSLFFPIIFTGSFTTIDDPKNDIENNLVKSIFAAKLDLNSFLSKKLPPQIYALIGNEIHLATRISKVYTTQNTESKYFFSYPFPVARITARLPIKKILNKLKRKEDNKVFIADINNRISIDINFDKNYFDNLINTNSSSEWKLTKSFLFEKFQWPQVEYIVVNRNLTKDVLLDLLDRVRDIERTSSLLRFGVVIQGNFLKRKDFNELKLLLETISASGVIILVGSKMVYNNLSSCKYIGLINKSLSYQKARAKLSFLLKLNLSYSKIIEFMGENISGEIAEYEKFPDWIQYENYPEDSEVIPIYPNINPKIYKHTIQRNLKREKTKDIYLYGFGNGHIPTIQKPISSIVLEYINDNNNFKFETLHKLKDTNDLSKIILFLNNNCIENRDVIFEYLTKKFPDKISISDNENRDEFINQYFKNIGDEISKRIVKDSLMNESETLHILGSAIDLGMTIKVKTNAISKTDHSMYPVGRLLLAIGVDSEIVKGWKIDLLQRKKEYQH